jgi:hypothetical protein
VKWQSFYRPGALAINGSTKLISRTAGSNNDKLGDFRSYNHSAATPLAPANWTKNWGPGGTTISITHAIRVEELNLRELTAGAAPYWTVRYYLSSANRAADTSRQRTYTAAASESSNTPPTGHTNNQTNRPSGATETGFTDANFPVSILVSNPDDILYCDIFLSDISGNIIARLGTTTAHSYTDLTTHELSNPFDDGCGPALSGAPSGYTTVFPVVTSSSSAKNGVDYTESNGGSTYGTFYWYLAGLKSSNWHRIGGVSCTANLKIRNPEGGSLENTTQIHTGSLNAAGASSNQSASGTLSSSYNWAYDDVGDVECTVSDWVTGFSEYQLASPTTSPTCT